MESNTKEKTEKSLFFPSFSILSVYALDFNRLYEKGYRALFFDIDNTLVYHDELALFETVKLFALLRAIGFQTAILSNNGESRVRKFAEAVRADYYIAKAGKPGPGAYLRAVQHFSLKKEECLFFGDQIFTDIVGGNRAGVPTVLVRPMGKEKYFHIVLKRILEKPFLLCYSIRHKLWEELP